jgi:hypothetical protein
MDDSALGDAGLAFALPRGIALFLEAVKSVLSDIFRVSGPNEDAIDGASHSCTT